jgi:hypothetical protein
MLNFPKKKFVFTTATSGMYSSKRRTRHMTTFLSSCRRVGVSSCRRVGVSSCRRVVVSSSFVIRHKPSGRIRHYNDTGAGDVRRVVRGSDRLGPTQNLASVTELRTAPNCRNNSTSIRISHLSSRISVILESSSLARALFIYYYLYILCLPVRSSWLCLKG